VLKILTSIFAVIGLLITLLIAAGIGGALYYQDAEVKEPDAVVLSLDFDQPVVEQIEPTPLEMAFAQNPTSLYDIINAIDKAKLDPHVKGIVAHFDDTQPSLTQSQEVRAALARFRESGKFTYAYGPSYGSFGQGNASYFLASSFENIWLQPVGSVSLTGVAVQSPFAKAALDKVGVQGDFMQREEYKSVMEMFTRDDFSPPVKVEMQALVEDLAQQIAGGIAESRHWDIEHVKNLMTEGPYTDEEALNAGLITHIGYRDELKNEIDNKAGLNSKFVNVDDYLAFKEPDDKKPTNATHVAYIHGTGLIANKAGGSGGLSGEHVMGANDIADAFDAAADDKKIRAIVFRVDSRGGSPEASETIRRAVVHAQLKGKPVIVSMGDVAASGGYWVAMNANRIIANPGTLTGSIGVVGGKFVVGGLAQKLGVNFETIKSTENAGIWSMVDGFSVPQRARVNALLDQTYQAFIKNVAAARKIPLETMPEIAKGRVWTGTQAIKVGLVDELGGFDVAMKAVRKNLNLTDTDLILLDEFPAPVSPAEKIIKLLKGFGVESSFIGNVLSQLHVLSMTLATLCGQLSIFDQPALTQLPAGFMKITR